MVGHPANGLRLAAGLTLWSLGWLHLTVLRIRSTRPEVARARRFMGVTKTVCPVSDLSLEVGPGETAEVRLRLAPDARDLDGSWSRAMSDRRGEAARAAVGRRHHQCTVAANGLCIRALRRLPAGLL